jgi:hypothetical protein
VTHVEVAVSSSVEVPGEKWPFASLQFPPTFQRFEDPAIVTDELVIVTAPLVNVALSCVAVPAPLRESKTTVSVVPGEQTQADPPDVVDQCVFADEKFPVPATQKQVPPPPPQAALAFSVHHPKRIHAVAFRRILRPSEKKVEADPTRSGMVPCRGRVWIGGSAEKEGGVAATQLGGR